MNGATRVSLIEFRAMQQETSHQTPDKPVLLGRFLLLHFRILQLFGLCPVVLQPPDDADKPHHEQRPRPQWRLKRSFVLWQCFHLVGVIVLQASFHTCFNSVLYSHDVFGQFNNILKLGTSVFAHCVSLVETMLRRRRMCDFLELYSKVHAGLSTGAATENYTIYRQFACKYCVYVVVIGVIEMTYAVAISFRYSWLLFFISFLPSGIICHLRILQFCFGVEMVRTELVELNRRMEHLVHFSRRLAAAQIMTPSERECEMCAELQFLMESYQNIYELSVLLKQSMPLSIAATYMKAYLMILSECYWSYWMVYNRQEIVEYLLLIPSTMAILLLITTSRDCMHAAKLLAHNLHRVRYEIENLNISTKIENFSLQLLHQEIIFDAFGFFVLNCDLARDILGSIATYMIFFIQFMPKFITI